MFDWLRSLRAPFHSVAHQRISRTRRRTGRARSVVSLATAVERLEDRTLLSHNPIIAGEYTFNGQPTRVEQSGDVLTFFNEHGNSSAGDFLSPTQVRATGWGNLTGTLSNGDIAWANGTIWLKQTTPPPAPTFPDISGSYSFNDKPTSVAQSGSSLTFTNENGGSSSGTFLSETQVVATNWGNLVGTLTNGNIVWANGSTWLRGAPPPPTPTFPDISGSYSFNGEPTSVAQSGSSLTFTNENGGSSSGTFLSETQVVATNWGNLVGTLTNGNIVWANGSTWLRGAPPPPTPTNPDISGSYNFNGMPTSVAQNGNLLTFTNENGGTSSGTFLDSTHVVATNWGNLEGTLTNGDIVWSNGSIWFKDVSPPPPITFPDIAGDYTFNGQPTHVAQSASLLTFTNEHGGSTPGTFLSSTQVEATAWGLVGNLVNGNIVWSNGSTWVKVTQVPVNTYLEQILTDVGTPLENGEITHQVPAELLFQFTSGVAIDPASLGGIQIIRAGLDGAFGNGNDVVITPSSKTIGVFSNEVRVQFAGTLPDDIYQITIFGSGPTPLKSHTGTPFNEGVNVVRLFQLDHDSQIITVDPPIANSNQITVHFVNALDAATAVDTQYYQLVDTKGTTATADDTVTNPIEVVYDVATQTAVLDFASIPAGSYQLQIGDSEAPTGVPVQFAPTNDDDSSFVTTGFLGELPATGAVIGAQIETQGLTPPPSQSAVAATVTYNFQNVYGTDTQGNVLINLMTEQERERAREAFEVYGFYLGVEFVETQDQGITVVTGDLRAIDPALAVGPGGPTGAATGGLDGLVVVDIGDGLTETAGGTWFQAALNYIGSTLSTGGFDLSPATPFFEGQHTLTQIRRGDSSDIDLYEFSLATPGTLSAEVFAERLGTSGLDSALTLFNSFGSAVVVADNSIGQDSAFEIALDAGTYYIGVSSAGNLGYNPAVSDSGTGGTTLGQYELHLDFTPVVFATAAGVPVDADVDGVPGGIFVYEFQTRPNIAGEYSLKVATQAEPDGSQSNRLTETSPSLDVVKTSVQQSGNGLTFVDETGGSSPGLFIGGNKVVATGWGNLVGTIYDGGIAWSNGVIWYKFSVPAGGPGAAANAPATGSFQLVQILPNIDGPLQDGDVRQTAPNELVFRFSPGEAIDPTSLGGISIVRSGFDGIFDNGNDVVVTPGFVGIGDQPHEVIFRFAENLPDDSYRITISGTGGPTVNIPGQSFTGVNPADPNGDVGLLHFVQAVNSSDGAQFTIYNKTDGSIATLNDGTLAQNIEFTSLAGATSLGDPVVTYDHLADRWVLTDIADFTTLNVYVSATADLLDNQWNHYTVTAPDLPDYPKLAVWPDAYYITTNEFNPSTFELEPAVYALDRTSMLLGDPAATPQRFFAPPLAGFQFQALTPADLDGPAPPTDEPNYFLRHVDDEAHNFGAADPSQDFLEVWQFDVDFATPANSAFTMITSIGIADFESDLNGLTAFDAFPQPGTSVQLDPLREVIMHRLQYRNFSTHETLVGSFVSDVDGTDHGGVRWFELRKDGSGVWALHQEGEIAPDADNRFMSAVAMDANGNIAVGYNITSTTVSPGLRYTGRLASDPLGTMLDERVLINGTGFSNSNRWGDYNSMSVDPVDGTTFWFTGAYTDGTGNWATRIGSFDLGSLLLAEPLRSVSGGVFNAGVDQVVNFELDLGAQVVAVDPQPITRNAGALSQALDQIVVYFNQDTLDQASAETPAFYQLINTQETLDHTDDTIVNPTGVVYDPVANTATLTFAAAIPAGTYRLRVGVSDTPVTTTLTIAAGSDDNSTFLTANTGIGVLDGSAQIVINAQIQPQPIALPPLPGGLDEPGHREIPIEAHFGSTGTDPAFPGNIATIFYNFQDIYGTDPQGNILFNEINEDQKQRTREIFELLGYYLGIEAVETENLGLIVVTGDLRAVDPLVPTGPGGVGGISEGSVSTGARVVMDNAEAWNDEYGGSWFQTALHEISHSLSLGHSYDQTSIQGGGLGANEPVFAGDVDFVHLMRLWRPDANDIDLYRFQLTETGLFTAETFAERLGSPSLLNTALSLFRSAETPLRTPIDLTAGSIAFEVGDAATLRARVGDTLLIDNEEFTVTLVTGSIITASRAANGTAIAAHAVDARVFNLTRGSIVARNDDYYSNDSYLELTLGAGMYFVGVTSTGNLDYNPEAPDTGSGGTTDGQYQLRINFQPTPQAGEILVDDTGTAFDGDADGTPGGAFDFWFQATDPSQSNTVYVDKASTSNSGALGSIANPYREIDLALAAATTRNQDSDPNNNVDIIRIVGNGGADGDLSTPGDAIPYLVGENDSGGTLVDGRTFIIPKGVTVMVDQGAVIKLQKTVIDVGSSSVLVNRGNAALQILGTPENRVVLTSFGDDSIGGDTDGPAADGANPGDWGGVVFRADSDIEEASVFLNAVYQADLSYGGGQVFVDSLLSVFNPIHMLGARPTVAFDDIRHSADSAMSANLASFDDAIRDISGQYNRDATLTRIGPDIHGNLLLDNSINGLFVNVPTLFGVPTEVIDFGARFDDTDIVHVITENVLIDGGAGGPQIVGGVMTARMSGRLRVDANTIVKLGGARIEAGVGNANLIIEGNQGTAGTNELSANFTSIFDDRYGRGGTFDTNDDDGLQSNEAIARPGDWAGLVLNAASAGSIDKTRIEFGGGLVPIEGGFDSFNVIEVHQAEFRLANSRLESNAGVASQTDRNGRGTNDATTVFIRGAQPVVYSNVFLNNDGSVASVNANAMSSDVVRDLGRSTGLVAVAADAETGDLLFVDNTGPLVRQNRFEGNAINGLRVRGEELTTESVWDDVDIVHVLFDEITIPNFHTFGGLRLKSAPDASLVVKLEGDDAGVTANGNGLDIDDRIGGTLQVIGQPLFPVVLTSLTDSSVGAGFDFDGLPQNDTIPGGAGGGGGGTLPTGPEVNNGTLIDNDVAATIPGHFESTPQAGGEISFFTSGVTAQGLTQLFVNQNFIFDFLNFVDVGSDGNAVSLSSTTITSPPTLISDDLVRSTGTFTGANGTVNWTAETRFDDGVATMFNTITFSSANPLGNLRFINYLDEDVLGVSDDVLQLQGTPGQANFRAFTLDQAEGIGFAQGGIYTAGPDLVNATYDGWAADQFPQLRSAITGAGTTYTVPGNIDLTDLPAIVDPFLGPVFGPNDVTTAFAWTVNPNLNTATITTFLELVAEPDAPSLAGDWRSLRLQAFSNDRNVAVANELEKASLVDGDINSTPQNAQHLGELSVTEKSADENRRAGFEVHGFISRNNPGDVDVYSFNAFGGTEVWLDIDRTELSLNTVLELVDPVGNVLAQSINNNVLSGLAFPLTEEPNLGGDFYTSNPNDAGMRVILPGTPGTLTTYFLRVHSFDVTGDGDGDTHGEYQLQIRLRQQDEHPGSTVRSSDIRFATNGIEVLGVPGHSPLVGESAEDASANNVFGQAQELGNLLASDRNTIGVSGNLSSLLDNIDFYTFTIDYDLIQSITGRSDGDRTWATIFDIDYADGISRPDSTLAVFDESGALIYIARESNVADDQPAPGQGGDFDDLSRGSIGKLDPFLGTVQLPAGIVPAGSSRRYFVAIANNTQLPTALDSTFLRVNSTNSLIRLEPVNSLQRIAEDHIGQQGYIDSSEFNTVLPTTQLFNILDSFVIDSHVTPFTLEDVVLFTNTGSSLNTVDPQFGDFETFVGAMRESAVAGNPFRAMSDIVMRSDGMLVGISGNLVLTIDTAGTPGNVSNVTLLGTTNIPTNTPTPNRGAPINAANTQAVRTEMNHKTLRQGIEAMTFERVGFTTAQNRPVYSAAFAVTEMGRDRDGIQETFQQLYRGGSDAPPNPLSNSVNAATGFRGYFADPGISVTSAEFFVVRTDANNNSVGLLMQAIVPGNRGNGIRLDVRPTTVGTRVEVNTPGLIEVFIQIDQNGNSTVTVAQMADLINASGLANQYVKVGFVGSGGINALDNFGFDPLNSLVTSGGVGDPIFDTDRHLTGMAFNDFFGGSTLYGVNAAGEFVSFPDDGSGANLGLAGANHAIPMTVENSVNGGSIPAGPIDATWVPNGPTTVTDGVVDGITDSEVIGAINAVLAHPTDPDIMYVGTVNGGVWRTLNATAANPDWTPLTDFEPSLSIHSLEFDPTDPSGQTLYAGVGRQSNFEDFGQAEGGARTGLLRSTNAGVTWTDADGASLNGREISGIAARGNIVTVAVDDADTAGFANTGIFRSTDGGTTFLQRSLTDGFVTGLPQGIAFDLASDPADSSVIYTGLSEADTGGNLGRNGIYRSANVGDTWTRVSNAAMEALIISGVTNNIEISVGTNNNVYVGIVNNGQLAGLFRSGDGGASWVELDNPTTDDVSNPGVTSSIKIASGLNGGPTLADGDLFGLGVTALGDLDGDGITDLAVGASGDDTDRGAVYIQFMNADGTVRSSTKIADGSNGGPALADGDRFGIAVGALGDLDGDGVVDLAVGADQPSNGTGAVHVLFLNTDGTVKSTTTISDGTGGGPTLALGDAFGIGLTSVGDLDGDGVIDLAVGARQDDTGGTDRGAAYILFLNTDGTAKSFTKLASNTGGGPTLSDGDNFGVGLSSLGDLDGDGVTELAVGAFSDDTGGASRGAAYIMFLNADGTAKNFTKIASDNVVGPILSDGDNFGVAVSSLGDMDGDGVADLAVGASQQVGSGGPGRGGVHLLFLNADGTVKSSTRIANGTNGGPSLADGDNYGIAVASLGDFDGDGVVDLAIGARGDDSQGADRGAVYVTFLTDNLGAGLHPDSEGDIQFSIVADPTNDQIVYVGGDSQPGPFPNAVGATQPSGRLFRVDASLAPGSQAAPITHDGTADGGAPHDGSRDMAFDAAGNLIEVDSGGIYKLTNPQGTTGDWNSLIGDLQVTEFHDIAYDHLRNVLFGGAQDIASLEQMSSGSAIWNTITTTTTTNGDGGDVAVDDSRLNQTFVYTSGTFLTDFIRREYNATGLVLQTLLTSPFLTGPRSFFEVEPNDTDATAQDLEAFQFTLDPNANITDAVGNNTSTTIPHVSIKGTGDDSVDVYSFTIANAGDRAIFDIDGSNSFNSFLTLRDSAGVVLATNNNQNPPDPGSSTFLDSLLDFNGFLAPGTYFIEVSASPTAGQAIPAGAGYTLHVSIQNHVLGVGMAAPSDAQEITPIEVNAVDGNRLLVAGLNNIYESTNQGLSFNLVATNTGANPDAIAYGGRLNGANVPNVFYVGSGSQIFVRTTAGLPTLTNYFGGYVRDIILDPEDLNTAFAIDETSVFVTNDTGNLWTDITGNLPGTLTDLSSISFIEAVSGDYLVVGGTGGIFVMDTAAPGLWNQLGLNLPNAQVADMEYDETDDTLVVGTLGRGSFTLANAAGVIDAAIQGTQLGGDIAFTAAALGPHNLFDGAYQNFIFALGDDGRLVAFDTNAPGAPLQRIFGSLTGIDGFLEVEPNDTLPSAQPLEPLQFLLNFDAAITDEAGFNTSTTIPHLTIQGGGNGPNDVDVYTFEVTTPNSRVIFDIDNSSGFDTWLTLRDSGGNFVAADDDVFPTDIGSNTSLDSLLDFVITTPGTYFIEVSEFPGTDPIPQGATYTLHVSIQNHQVGNGQPPNQQGSGTFFTTTETPGASGLAFSPLDFNLWHPTEHRGSDAGHGVNAAPDQSRNEAPDIASESADSRTNPQTAGGLSLYFGLEQWVQTPVSSNRYLSYESSNSQLGIVTSEFHRDLASNPAIGDNYNLPGGAYGSLMTNSFSLAGYHSTDRPTLYFNYFLETEDQDADLGSASPMRDSARVFVSADGGQTFFEVSTNNSVRSDTSELPSYFTHTASENPNFTDNGRDFNQELYDNTPTWRQARVDLSAFAGQNNLILRVDFATAGSIINFAPGSPNDSALPGNQYGNFFDNRRGQNNQQFEGLFVDDFIIGFAERGEMVTEANASQSAFTTVPQNPADPAPTEVLVGPYQLEIRRGTEYGENINGLDPDITLFRTFDTNTGLVAEDGLLGDQNLDRRTEQGVINISGNQISNVSEYGIRVDADLRDAGSNLAHPGSVRVLPTLNNQRLAPATIIQNNVISNFGIGGILLSGDSNAGNVPNAVVPFHKIVNNTVYGGASPTGTGIEVNQNASPTILNNIVANTVNAITIDGTSQTSVVGTTVFQNNGDDGARSALELGSNAIELLAGQPLFVDAAAGNFYLAAGSRAIDSSLNRLQDRPAIVGVKSPLGILPSDIFAPNDDVFGQLRVDDPLQSPPPGLGFQVFKDRGAIERADFVGPTAQLIMPLDQGPRDFDLDLTEVLSTTFPSEFVVKLFDTGIGINDVAIQSNQFELRRDGTLLVEGRDYLFVYNANSDEVTFRSTLGPFGVGVYTIEIDNTDARFDGINGVRDLAGLFLQPNQANGTVLFTIALGSELSVDDVSVVEGDAGQVTANFTVSLTGPSDTPVTVEISTADGTATLANNDYVEIPTTTLTFLPGGPLTQTVSVLVNGDTTGEPDETFFLNLANVTNARIGDDQGIGTIVNDDPPSISVDDVTIDEPDVGVPASAVFTVSLSNPPEGPDPVTVSFATIAGSATANEDYIPVVGTLTFDVGGPLTQQVSVQIVGDSIPEGTENFFLQLFGESSNSSILDELGEGTISDLAKPLISINDVSVPEGDIGQANFAVFTVTMSQPVTREIRVNYATSNVTATAGVDYTVQSGTLVFSVGGELSQQILVPIIADETPEPNETFVVILSTTTASLLDGTGIATIINDDDAPRLAAGTGGTTTAAPLLQRSQLDAIIAQAIAEWDGVLGVNGSLGSVTFQVEDLPGDLLGLASAASGTVSIDVDGAGYGWFIDATPAMHEEFAFNAASGQYEALAGTAADGMDLYTLVLHELGHILGLGDLDPSVVPNDLMTGTQPVGIRQLPNASHAALVNGAGTADDTIAVIPLWDFSTATTETVTGTDDMVAPPLPGLLPALTTSNDLPGVDDEGMSSAASDGLWAEQATEVAIPIDVDSLHELWSDYNAMHELLSAV